MPSVYNYRHVELDKVGRGKRVIKPPGGETADIFGLRTDPSYSSASSQAGSDVASSRVHIETDQQSIGGSSLASSQQVDGLVVKQQINNGEASPNGSVDSARQLQQQQQQLQNNQQPLLMADDYKPVNQQQQQLLQQQQQLQQEVNNRSPKKTIPVIRRNPITGEIYENPSDRQPAVVRVRQPPGGRSSGIF